MSTPAATILMIWICGATSAGHAIEKCLVMEIGDPARKEKKAQLVLDAISDTRTGELLRPADLVQHPGRGRATPFGDKRGGLEGREQGRVRRLAH